MYSGSLITGSAENEQNVLTKNGWENPRKGEGARKPAGVRRKSAICLQLRFMNVLTSNEYTWEEDKDVEFAALLEPLLSGRIKTFFLLQKHCLMA